MSATQKKERHLKENNCVETFFENKRTFHFEIAGLRTRLIACEGSTHLNIFNEKKQLSSV